MAQWKKLDYGKTITGGKPGEKIKKCVEELQEKTVTDIVSAVPGYDFAKVGDNTIEMRVATDGETEGNNDLVKEGKVEMGSVGELHVRKSKGSYIIDITFPKGPEATSGGGGEDGDIPTGGESPYITIAPIIGGTRVTVHNPDGTTNSFDVMNGTNGQDGHDGLVTSIDSDTKFSAINPNGNHSMFIEGGKIKISIDTLEIGLSELNGKLGLSSAAGSPVVITGPDIATCIAFDDGDS